MIISKTGKKQWVNCHETFIQDIDDLYDLADNHSDSMLDDYNDATQGIQGIIKDAIVANKKLRVVGGGWSFTKIAATDGIILNSKPLNISFRMSSNNISSACTQSCNDFYFSQCGVSVKELNNRLAKRNRSLKTSGASNGQTIAGAVSTGTHGSAIDVGSITDGVLGLHIIVSPTRHIWLERKSCPVVSHSFVSALQAELIQDDKLFNAALVSFGSFGFIHGVLMETVPLFLYECHRLEVSLDSHLAHLMETLDFTNCQIPLPHGNERPYHFQVVINPYNKKNKAHVTIMYKLAPKPYTASVIKDAMGPGDDAPVFIGTIATCLPALVPSVVNNIMGAAYKPFENVFGTHGEIFCNSDTHGKVLSAAIGVALKDVNKVREKIHQMNKSEGPFAGIFSFRYVKGTKALLGFTQFEFTCIIELDCVMSDAAYEFYIKVWNEIERLAIPFTFHWGKILDLNSSRIRNMYGHNIVDDWLKARNKLMRDAASMQVFTNDLMVQWGLDTILMNA